MSTSRPSEPRTVLLWGDRWWLPGCKVPVAFPGMAGAVEALAAHYAEEPKPMRLRLLFQPDDLVSVAVACPKGDRPTIARALAAEFPALLAPDHVWSHEPVLAAGEGFSTYLHHESEPRLLALATELARRGFAVDSAWPLATWLQAVPTEWSRSGGFTVVAIAGERALAYHHPADGTRTIRQWRGGQVAPEVARWIEESRGPEHYVVLLSNEDADLPPEAPRDDAVLEDFCDVEGFPDLDCWTLTGTLQDQVTLPRYHPAQLLPRPPLVTGGRMVMAAGIALLLTAAAVGGWQGWQMVRMREAAAQHAHALRELQAEVAHLRDNARTIATLRRELTGGAGGPPVHEFLSRIEATIPPELVLSKVEVDGPSIAIEGWAAPGAAASEGWRLKLAATGPWTLAAQPLADGAFRLAGNFRP